MDGTSTPCPRSMLPHTWCGAHLVFLSRDWDRSPMCCHCAGLVFGWKPSKELEKHGLCPAHRKRLRVSQARLPSSTESDLNNGHHHQSKSAGAISSMGRKGRRSPREVRINQGWGAAPEPARCTGAHCVPSLPHHRAPTCVPRSLTASATFCLPGSQDLTWATPDRICLTAEDWEIKVSGTWPSALGRAEKRRGSDITATRSRRSSTVRQPSCPLGSTVTA